MSGPLASFWPQAPPDGYRLILPYDWEEKARAMDADRLEWVKGVKGRLGLLEPGDDAVARVAEWDADHGRWPRLEDGLTDWQKLGYWNELSMLPSLFAPDERWERLLRDVGSRMRGERWPGSARAGIAARTAGHQDNLLDTPAALPYHGSREHTEAQ